MALAGAPPAGLPVASVRDMIGRRLHIGIVVTMLVIVMLGFWPFYRGLPGSGAEAHWVVNLHAVVFVGWMLLLLAQVVLVYRRRIATHRSLGRVGIGYAIVLVLSGIAITVVTPVIGLREGTTTLDAAAGFLILPIGDLLLFSGFFAAAIAARKKRELHKRLMVLAAVAVIFPGAARFAIPWGPGAVAVVWLFPLALAMTWDAVMLRRIERVYLVGLVILLVGFSRVALMESEAWLVIGRRIVGGLVAIAPGGTP